MGYNPIDGPGDWCIGRAFVCDAGKQTDMSGAMAQLPGIRSIVMDDEVNANNLESSFCIG